MASWERVALSSEIAGVDGLCTRRAGLLPQAVATTGATKEWSWRHPDWHGDNFDEARQQLQGIHVSRGTGAGARCDDTRRLLLPPAQQQGVVAQEIAHGVALGVSHKVSRQIGRLVS